MLQSLDKGMDKTFQPDRCESYRTVQLDNPTPRNISCSLEILFRVTNFGMGLHLVLGAHGIAGPEFLARQLFSGILSRVLQPRAQDTIIILKSRTGSIDDSLLGIYYAALLPQPRSCSKTRRFRTRACTYRSQDLRGYYRHKVRSDVIFIRCESFYIALQRPPPPSLRSVFPPTSAVTALYFLYTARYENAHDSETFHCVF